MNELLHQGYKPKYKLDFLYFGEYFKKSLKHNDSFSEFILDVKRGDRNALLKAADLFRSVLPFNAHVCVVPSSKVTGSNSLSRALSIIENEKQLHRCRIKRIKSVGKKSTGEGTRGYSEERDSISYIDDYVIKNRNIYLIDDISTSGVSLAACRDLLMESGANNVICITLGNTVSAADYYNKVIIGFLMIRGLGRKYASEMLDRIDYYRIESNEQIYEKLVNYSYQRRSISIPVYEEFCRYIEDADVILKRQEESGVVAINKYSNSYPEKFKDILAPPVILFARGNQSLLHGYEHIAIVGSRDATPHGCKIAYRLGELFAEKNIVVSGLAKGCDTFGHRGCLDARGKTIAILPSPVTAPEPKENIDLANRIVKSDGLLLSEYYYGQKVQRGYYVARDRLQSALSDAVVVIETESDGGTMHTVEYCRDQNRLLACYRHPDSYINMEQLDGNKLLLENDAIPIGNREELEFFYRKLVAKRNELKHPIPKPEQLDFLS